jgi:hypothetical protein
MTPVFATPEALARYCVDNDVCTFGHDTTTYENWLSFINGPGWAPSAIVIGDTLHSGVDAMASLEKRD